MSTSDVGNAAATVFTNIPQPIIGHSANAMSINPAHAIADTGATSVFVMKDTQVQNKLQATKPISISLPDGAKVKSMHICDVTISGLLITLTGHIVPEMTMASLLGIRVLCKAGCKVVFTDAMCQVIYKGKVILTGYKDPKSNLWTLPIFQEAEILPSNNPQKILTCTIILRTIIPKGTIILEAVILPSNNPQPMLTHTIILHTIIPK